MDPNITELLIQLSSILTPDLALFAARENPELLINIEKVCDALAPQPDKLPGDVQAMLAEVNDKTQRFMRAVKMLGAKTPAQLQQLAQLLQNSGLLNSAEKVAGLAKSISEEHQKQANSQLGLVYPVTIRGVKNLVGDIPFHITLKCFTPGSHSPDHIKSKLEGANLNPPDVKDIHLTPTIITSKRDGSKHHVLELSHVPGSMKEAYDRLDGMGIQHPTYRPHITVDKKLWDEVRDKKLSAGDLKLEVHPLEMRNGGKLVHRWEPELKKTGDDSSQKGLKHHYEVAGDIAADDELFHAVALYTAHNPNIFREKPELATRLEEHLKRVKPFARTFYRGEPAPSYYPGDWDRRGLPANRPGDGRSNSFASWTSNHHTAKGFARDYLHNGNVRVTPGPVQGVSLSDIAEHRNRLKPKENHFAGEQAEWLLLHPAADYLKKSESLTKGKNGDWKAEGYTFKLHPQKERDEGYRDYRITAHDKNGEEAGFYAFQHTTNGKPVLTVKQALTQEKHRRKGLATAAYKMIEDHIGLPLYPDGSPSKDKKTWYVSRYHLTNAARALWNQPNRTFGADNMKEDDTGTFEEDDTTGDKDFNPKPVNKSDLAKSNNRDTKGYRFSHETEEAGGYRWMYVKVHDQTGKHIGYAEISADYPGLRHAQAVPHNTWVHEYHRRKGIATAMYQYAEKHLGMKLSPDSEQSKDAKKLWSQPNRPFGKSNLAKGKNARERRKEIFGADGKGRHISHLASNIPPKLKEKIDMIDRGELVFDKQKGWLPGTSPDAKVNRRAREKAKDPSRKDAKTLLRSEKLKSILEKARELLLNDLSKAIDPGHWSKFMNDQSAHFKNIVDHSAHVRAGGADTAFANHLNAPERHVPNSSHYQSPGSFAFDSGNGISTKQKFLIPRNGKISEYMIKPYHANPEHGTELYAHTPISGWASLATRALYRAGGLGNQIEHAHAHEYRGTPVVVTRFHENHKTSAKALADAQSGLAHMPKYNPMHIHQIGVMDFLTGNIDRHGDNLMVNKRADQHGFHGLVAIDNGMAFRYHQNPESFKKFAKPGEKLMDHPANYIDFKHLGKITSHVSNLHQYEGAAKEWWKKNRENISAEMNRQLAHIKHPKVQKHIAENFKARYETLNKWANSEEKLFSRSSNLHTQHHEILNRYGLNDNLNSVQQNGTLQEKTPRVDVGAKTAVVTPSGGKK